ncbi:YidH family protein [Dermacoccaceae bacterium W4C1]
MPPSDDASDPQPTAPDRRRPRSVYAVGGEVDPRFSLANERTLLAWIRTSLALLAGAVALDVLDIPVPEAVARALSVLLGLVAALIAGTSWWRWAKTERAMRTGGTLPTPVLGLILVVLVVIAAVVLTLWPR